MDNIYRDIAQRTNGDIYVGIVGPVRTGKSTFIKKFMECLVLPNISDTYSRDRAIDELPQSAAGRTIMTTEPKFIPNEAVNVNLGDGVNMRVRMIDCVGYIVPNALGYIENEMPRMVRTPWFEEEIPFNMAAEIGTQKVINEHSTIGILVTTDGTIGEIKRNEYIEAEQRIVSELKNINKPFVIVLNTVDPTSEAAIQTAKDMQSEYGVKVVPVNCLNMDEKTISEILMCILFEFPINEISINMPGWINSLENGHWLKKSIYDTIISSADGIYKVSELNNLRNTVSQNENVLSVEIEKAELGNGSVTLSVKLTDGLFYRIIKEKTGLDVSDEATLMNVLKTLSDAKTNYDRVASALESANETGYGIVMPTMDELRLEEPEMVRQGGRYGVKLKASAPSIHMIRADIQTEVSPIVGSERQSEDLVRYLLTEFEEEPTKIWNSNIFGKSLHELVNEGLHSKLEKMPDDAREKIKDTLERIINEGSGGLICIIL